MNAGVPKYRPVTSFVGALRKVKAARRDAKVAAEAARPRCLILAKGARISIVSRHGFVLGSPDASRVAADRSVAGPDTCYTLIPINGDESVFGLRLDGAGGRFLSVAAERESDRTGVACAFVGVPSGLQAWRLVANGDGKTVSIISRVTGQLLCAAPQGEVWLAGTDEGDVATLLGWTRFGIVDRGSSFSSAAIDGEGALEAPFTWSLPLASDAVPAAAATPRRDYPSTPDLPRRMMRGSGRQ
jgi:hypothetical protein